VAAYKWHRYERCDWFTQSTIPGNLTTYHTATCSLSTIWSRPGSVSQTFSVSLKEEWNTNQTKQNKKTIIFSFGKKVTPELSSPSLSPPTAAVAVALKLISFRWLCNVVLFFFLFTLLCFVLRLIFLLALKLTTAVFSLQLNKQKRQGIYYIIIIIIIIIIISSSSILLCWSYDCDNNDDEDYSY